MPPSSTPRDGVHQSDRSDAGMSIELVCAARFLSSLIKSKMTPEEHEGFQKAFVRVLEKRFEGHWFPEQPDKGNAFRCIRLVNGMDPVLEAVSADCKIRLAGLLPANLTLWIDPSDVSVRIGDAGSVWSVMTDKENSPANGTSKCPSPIPIVSCASEVAKPQDQQQAMVSVS